MTFLEWNADATHSHEGNETMAFTIGGNEGACIIRHRDEVPMPFMMFGTKEEAEALIRFCSVLFNDSRDSFEAYDAKDCDHIQQWFEQFTHQSREGFMGEGWITGEWFENIAETILAYQNHIGDWSLTF